MKNEKPILKNSSAAKIDFTSFSEKRSDLINGILQLKSWKFNYLYLPPKKNPMLQSMTGYGRASKTFGDKTITVELRSLNSKFLDMRLRIPITYKEKETELRKMITQKLVRGKVDLTIESESASGESDFAINKNLFQAYYREMKELSEKLDIPNPEYIQAIMRIPNVVGPSGKELSEQEWGIVQETMEAAIRQINEFRTAEGAATSGDLRGRVEAILEALGQVPPLEAERKKNMRKRLQQNLDEYLGSENVDKNRFEQEVLFYIEKIDISEEKVRLAQHCQFFIEQLEDKKNRTKGRKLSFISQEMGREINTLGAKAYSSGLQRLVVKMKDELEKIKEQVANVV